MSNPIVPAQQLVALCAAADVEPDCIRQAMLPDGHLLAVCNVEGSFHVVDDTCTHGAASLSEEGALDGWQLECNWHFGRFDVRTGAACAMPCTEPLKVWPVQIVDGQVCVAVGPELS